MWKDANAMTKYYIRRAMSRDKWEETTKEIYVKHERAAGFRNTMGQPKEPATAGFSSSIYPVEGKTQYVSEHSV